MTDTTLISEVTAGSDGAGETVGQSSETLLGGAGQHESGTEAGGDGAALEGQGAGDNGQQQEGDGPTGAPDEYEAFTLPEGVTIDPEVDTNLKTLAKELNLNQAQAQKVADLGAQLSQKWASSLQSQIDANAEAWAEATRTDQELGGDKLQENLGLAKSTLDKFGTPELRTLLNDSRLGNNPEVIRLLVNVGRAVSDDNRITSGKPPAPSGKSHSERLYPSSK